MWAGRPLTRHPRVDTLQTCHFLWGPPGRGADKVKAPLILVFRGGLRAWSSPQTTARLGAGRWEAQPEPPWRQVRSMLDPQGTVGGTESLAAGRGPANAWTPKEDGPEVGVSPGNGWRLPIGQDQGCNRSAGLLQGPAGLCFQSPREHCHVLGPDPSWHASPTGRTCSCLWRQNHGAPSGVRVHQPR